ncbi:hypothetical protein As57867_007003, partial [Aphanomyces stellatus]
MWRRRIMMRMYTYILLLLLLRWVCVDAAAEQQESVVAVCVAWNGVACPFTNTTNPLTKLFNRETQTLCKAAVSITVKQIDWQSYHSTGKGLIRSVKINQNELLTSFVYPSDAYLQANYPHCDDWFDVLPPHDNSLLPGRGTQRSILPYITGDAVEFNIEFEWTGDHSQQPVCSFGGVSYVGMARMDLFYEVQDDKRKASFLFVSIVVTSLVLVCPGWNGTSKTWCHGHGQCDCAGMDGANRTCSCQPGYAPPTCEGCLANTFGPTCSTSCAACYNGGLCMAGINGTGDCACPAGFDPDTRCATCLPSHYGPQCLPCRECHFPHGNCNDGIQGNGLCSCAVGYNASVDCADCMDSFFGPTCAPCKSCHAQGVCNHGLAGDGACLCREGFDADTRCTNCSTNYFGANCTRCASCHGR